MQHRMTDESIKRLLIIKKKPKRLVTEGLCFNTPSSSTLERDYSSNTLGDILRAPSESEEEYMSEGKSDGEEASRNGGQELINIFYDHEQGVRLVEYESSNSITPSDEALDFSKPSEEGVSSSLCGQAHIPGNPIIPNLNSSSQLSISASVNRAAGPVLGTESARMMDCPKGHCEDKGVDTGGIEDKGEQDTDLDEDCQEVDIFIDKMGFKVFDRDGNLAKLSTFLTLQEKEVHKVGEGQQGSRGARELRKLAWDMKDGKSGDCDKSGRRLGRGNLSNVKL